jgi:predicted tellurium resistance membrane protein TerC
MDGIFAIDMLGILATVPDVAAAGAKPEPTLANNIFTLFMLVLLQAVLGFDNLLYISLESKRVEGAENQKKARQLGIGLAIGLRIVLLFVVLHAVERFQTELFGFDLGFVEGHFTGHSLIVLFGGLFIVYTAVKEISHMIVIDELGDHEEEDKSKKSLQQVVAWILLMNLVFSFDSILSAMALTHVFWVMATAIVISGIMMIALADKVADFLQKNRLYEVMGLFILLIVGVMLLSEGGHLAHLKFWEHPVEAMTKTTFYFSIGVLVLVDLAQSRYQKKLLLEAREKKAEAEAAKDGSVEDAEA